MTVTVAKWGNGLAIRIPASEAAKASIQEGDEVATASQKGRLIVQKVRKEPNFDRLYARITPDNCHTEADWGQSVGREKIEC